MKKILFLFFVFNCNLLNAQNVFSSTFDIDSTSETGSHITLLPNGNYLVIGGFIHDELWTQGLVTLLLDNEGNLLERKLFIDSMYIYYPGYNFSLLMDGDGNRVIFSGIDNRTVIHDDEYAHSAFMIKINADGDTLWTRHYGGWDDDEGMGGWGLTETGNGNYLGVGRTWRYDQAGKDNIFLLMTDTAGNVLMEHTYGIGESLVGTTITATTDGGFLLGGGSREIEALWHWDTYLVKIDSLGNEVWDSIWGTPYQDCRAGIVRLKSQTGYRLLSCEGGDMFGDDLFYYAAKLDENLQEVWRYDFSLDNPTTLISNMVELKDGSFIISGSKIDADLNQYIGTLYLLSANGELIWQKEYYSNLIGWNSLYDVEPTPDGGFVATGVAMGQDVIDNQEEPNIWVIKTDCEGNLEWSNACNPIGMEENAPPQREYLSVRQGGGLLEVGVGWLPGGGSGRLLLYDAAGRLLWEQTTAGQAAHSFNLSGMAAGVYFVRLVSEQGEGLQTKKVLVR